MVIIFSLIPLIYLFVMDTPAKYTFFYFTALPGLFVGIVLFVSSRVLAKLVCFDFDKSDD